MYLNVYNKVLLLLLLWERERCVRVSERFQAIERAHYIAIGSMVHSDRPAFAELNVNDENNVSIYNTPNVNGHCILYCSRCFLQIMHLLNSLFYILFRIGAVFVVVIFHLAVCAVVVSSAAVFSLFVLCYAMCRVALVCFSRLSFSNWVKFWRVVWPFSIDSGERAKETEKNTTHKAKKQQTIDSYRCSATQMKWKKSNRTKKKTTTHTEREKLNDTGAEGRKKTVEYRGCVPILSICCIKIYVQILSIKA